MRKTSRLSGALIALVLTALALAAPSARAQSDALTVEARARFDEGVQLFDQGRYEAARAKFKEAYALKPHPKVLVNLGWSSLNSGHPREAESAFARYLRDAKDAQPAERAEAERGLSRAREDAGEAATTTTTSAPAAPAARAPDRPADASGAPTEQAPFVVGALLGFSSTNLNLGLGVRAGKDFWPRVYVGGTFVYNFGTSYSVQTLGGTAQSSLSAFYVGPEGGYDFTFGSLLVRPYVGLGLLSTTASTGLKGGQSVSVTDSGFVVWPGATALYEVPGTSFTIGGDVRMVTVPGGPAFGLFGFGAMRF